MQLALRFITFYSLWDILDYSHTTPLLLKLVVRKKLQSEKFATHFFSFDEFIDSYDAFSRASETKALKVVLTNK